MSCSDDGQHRSQSEKSYPTKRPLYLLVRKKERKGTRKTGQFVGITHWLYTPDIGCLQSSLDLFLDFNCTRNRRLKAVMGVEPFTWQCGGYT